LSFQVSIRARMSASGADDDQDLVAVFARDPHQIRTWDRPVVDAGTEPATGHRSPARLLRDGDVDEVGPAVVGAARAFLIGR
jgi:hypothetical protein